MCEHVTDQLLEGLIQGFQAHPKMPVAISLGSAAYRSGAVYKPTFSREVACGVLKAALAARIVRVEPGMRPLGIRLGQVTLAWPEGRFLTWLRELDFEWCRLSPLPHEQLLRISNRAAGEPVRNVLDCEGRGIATMRRNLALINDFLSRQCIALELRDDDLQRQSLTGANLESDQEESVIDFFRNQLYRVFAQGSLTKGGRFYGGWWQHVRRHVRPRILINGFRTIELDFDSLALHMLYAKEGLSPPVGDHYDLGFGFASKDDPRRALVKKYVIAIINDEDGRYRLSQDELNLLGTSMAGLQRRLAMKHAAITRYFGSGIGVELQLLDAQIAEYVMLEFLDLGEVCLPIHDSFIVRAGLQSQLKDVMSAGYEAVMKNQITSSLKAGFEGPSIARPTEKLLELVTAESSDQDVIATVIAHMTEYKLLFSWLTSWEKATLPEFALRNDAYPLNLKRMRKARA